MNLLLCPDSVPNLLGLFDTLIAPPLLYYSYIPVVLISLFFGFYIFFRNKSLESKTLFAFSIFFSLWVINILVQWIAVHANIVYFSWQITAVLEIFIPLLAIYFTYVFLEKKRSAFLEGFSLVIVLIIALLTPTEINTISFDLMNCEANIGPLLKSIYAFEIISIPIILFFALRKIFSKKSGSTERTQAGIIAIGLGGFIGIFAVSNIFGEITQTYEINLVGPIGMALLLSLLSYMIVRFKAFTEAKLLGAQILVAVIWALTGSLLFLNDLFYIHLIIGITIVVLVPVGISLVRSVKREVALRTDLELANKRQQETMRFITHEVKGYLTDGAAALDALGTGSFGPVTPDMKSMVGEALVKNRAAVREIQNFLRIADFKTGKVAYGMKSFDFKKKLEDALVTPTENAQTKGLSFTTDVAPGDYTMVGDGDQILNHVIVNLVNNGVNYTPTGDVTVHLERNGTALRFSVKDSGVGLTDDDKKVLFTEGGHGKESRTVNPHSTGYGLFIAKQIVDAHHGRMWAESAGRGTGSTFFVELPTNLRPTLNSVAQK